MPATLAISLVDRHINAIHRQLRRLERIVPLSAERRTEETHEMSRYYVETRLPPPHTDCLGATEHHDKAVAVEFARTRTGSVKVWHETIDENGQLVRRLLDLDSERIAAVQS